MKGLSIPFLRIESHFEYFVSERALALSHAQHYGFDFKPGKTAFVCPLNSHRG